MHRIVLPLNTMPFEVVVVLSQRIYHVAIGVQDLVEDRQGTERDLGVAATRTGGCAVNVFRSRHKRRAVPNLRAPRTAAEHQPRAQLHDPK